MHTQQVVSVTVEQMRERWSDIVAALVAHGIGPDIVTVAALSLGVSTLAANLGIEEVSNGRRPIGFAPPTAQNIGLDTGCIVLGSAAGVVQVLLKE